MVMVEIIQLMVEEVEQVDILQMVIANLVVLVVKVLLMD